MEKSNFINIISSIILMVAGAAFILFSCYENNWNLENIIFAIIGGIFVLYGIIRIYLTNKSSKQNN